jgi:hypothetical protein
MELTVEEVVSEPTTLGVKCTEGADLVLDLASVGVTSLAVMSLLTSLMV